ncbi:DUF4190 domain-containing protein [Paenibacillus aceti]|uniref:DUF4190 domain-containing protein n=1 Tax=Paenibacillus aceti TaxID=1820010 RepID=A0ABQ1W5V5_9BACL|nr:DUF4190 domain-containing protein [Paenibacillus aceti]GGG14346.1 hypothetical protein GCM10010913_40200 [Paenibacillus aceti]
MDQNPSDQYQYSVMNNYPPPFPPGPPVVPKTNGKSIAALVLGILSTLFILFPYIGIILGIMAIIFSSLSLKEIKRRYEQGRGMAIAGMVCGIIGTIITGIILIFMVLVLVIYAGSTGGNEIYSNF